MVQYLMEEFLYPRLERETVGRCLRHMESYGRYSYVDRCSVTFIMILLNRLTRTYISFSYGENLFIAVVQIFAVKSLSKLRGGFLPPKTHLYICNKCSMVSVKRLRLVSILNLTLRLYLSRAPGLSSDAKAT